MKSHLHIAHLSGWHFRPRQRLDARSDRRAAVTAVAILTLVAVVLGSGCHADQSGSSPATAAGAGTVPVVVQPVEAPAVRVLRAEGMPAIPLEPVEPEALSAIAGSAGEETPASAATEAAEAPSAPPQLTAPVQEVVQLAQAQVSAEVLLAYIEGAESPFKLKAADILYLTDLGVSAETIAAMVRQDQLLKEKAATEASSVVETSAGLGTPATAVSAGAPPAPESGASQSIGVVEGAVEETEVAVTAPTQAVSTDYFYTALSPYGTWIEVPDYGWCWQPSAAVVQTDWRPYSDGGRWIWTDYGWYWKSYYSWGWAPFHYGRWHLSAGRGWVWVPDNHWGPAWVTWRYYDGYCGWAPLPPGCVYTSGLGFSYYGSRVGFSFGFGLSSYWYSFVPTAYFCHSRPWHYRVPHTTVNNFYGNTTVINNYGHGNRNTIINRGVGTDLVAASSRTEIRKVRVTDGAHDGTVVRGERLSRDGTTLAVHRPNLAQPTSRPPAAVVQRQEQTKARANALLESRPVQAARVNAASSGSSGSRTAARSGTAAASSRTEPRVERSSRSVIDRSSASGTVTRPSVVPERRETSSRSITTIRRDEPALEARPSSVRERTTAPTTRTTVPPPAARSEPAATRPGLTAPTARPNAIPQRTQPTTTVPNRSSSVTAPTVRQSPARSRVEAPRQTTAPAPSTRSINRAPTVPSRAPVYRPPTAAPSRSSAAPSVRSSPAPSRSAPSRAPAVQAPASSGSRPSAAPASPSGPSSANTSRFGGRTRNP